MAASGSGTSIQGLIEDALRELDGREVGVAGAGRTDAGVHALGQVASFALHRPLEPEKLVRALNARLPADIRVGSANAVPVDFHARFGAKTKTYRYRICNADVNQSVRASLRVARHWRARRGRDGRGSARA